MNYFINLSGARTVFGHPVLTSKEYLPESDVHRHQIRIEGVKQFKLTVDSDHRYSSEAALFLLTWHALLTFYLIKNLLNFCFRSQAIK